MRISIGKAFASNMINTIIFRQSGIFTYDYYQYTSFFHNKECLRIIRRNLLDDSIKTHDIKGNYDLCDAHNSISMSCDNAGYVHISYQQHTSELQYRRTKQPLLIDDWTEEIPMTGLYEENITYPCFLPIKNTDYLLFLFRDGTSGCGSLRIKRWDSSKNTWKDYDLEILSGENYKFWRSSPYWNTPSISDDGSIHLAFTWRTKHIKNNNNVNNINIDYAKSHDYGQTWVSSNEMEFYLPITQVNSETIHPVQPGSNLINQSGMAVDKENRPHLVFYSNDWNGIPQYQHLWYDGKSWKHNFISNRKTNFTLNGHGTLQIPISRPEIVIDSNNHVYVIYQGDLTGRRFVAQRLRHPDYIVDFDDKRILLDEDIGMAEPVIDQYRWKRDGILTLLIQKCGQPHHDKYYDVEEINDISILDVKLSDLWDINSTDSSEGNIKYLSGMVELTLNSKMRLLETIYRQKNVVTELRKNIDEKTKKLDEKTKKLDEIKNSRSYKLITFPKKLFRKIFS